MHIKPIDPIKPVIVSCNTCRLWQVKEGGKDGICRRFAPRPTTLAIENKGAATARPQVVWPSTLPGDWCGEWRPLNGDIQHTAPASPQSPA